MTHACCVLIIINALYRDYSLFTVPTDAALSTLVEDIKRRCSDAQLDTEIPTKDLHILAGCFDNYEDFLDKLGLSPSQCKDIKAKEYQNNSQSAMREALRLWRARNPGAATFRELLRITLILRNKEIVTDNICRYICKDKDNPLLS